MTLRTLLAAAALACCCGACATPVEPGAEDDYAVYSAALEHAQLQRSSTRFVIESQTRPSSGEGTDLDLPGLEQQTLDDLLAQTTSAPLQPRFALSAAVDLVPRDELDQLLAHPPGDELAAWKRFADRYPGAFGFIGLTGVGYNARRTQALVGVSRFCGSLCGEGWAVLLALSDGRWTVTAIQMLWIS